jgi:hypothetical protein
MAQHVLDKDHPQEWLVNTIWRLLRRDKYATEEDVVRNLLFKSNNRTEYIRPAPNKPRIAWIDVDVRGFVVNLPKDAYLGQVYVIMPHDFNSKRESVEAYMTRKRFVSTD